MMKVQIKIKILRQELLEVIEGVEEEAEEGTEEETETLEEIMAMSKGTIEIVTIMDKKIMDKGDMEEAEEVIINKEIMMKNMKKEVTEGRKMMMMRISQQSRGNRRIHILGRF